MTDADASSAVLASKFDFSIARDAWVHHKCKQRTFFSPLFQCQAAKPIVQEKLERAREREREKQFPDVNASHTSFPKESSLLSTSCEDPNVRHQL